MQESSGADSGAQVRLEALVRQTIEEQGEEFEGKTWAIRPRQEWADMAGVSTKTVTRTFQKPPFDTLQKVWNERQAILVRIGKPNPNQPTRLAKKMAVIFEAQTGQRVSTKAYGCLHGLVQEFRFGWQVEIFKYAISAEGWKTTMMLAKPKLEDLETPIGYILDEKKGASFIKLKPGKARLFFKYPYLPALRLFWMCAESAYVASHMKTNLSEVPKDEVDFWEEWWEERDPFALDDWEPNWKASFDPIKDVKG